MAAVNMSFLFKVPEATLRLKWPGANETTKKKKKKSVLAVRLSLKAAKQDLIVHFFVTSL